MPQAVAFNPPRDNFTSGAEKADKPRVYTGSTPSGETGSVFSVPPLDLSSLLKKSASYHDDSSNHNLDDACTTGVGQLSSEANPSPSLLPFTLTSVHPSTTCKTAAAKKYSNVNVNSEKTDVSLTQQSRCRQRDEEELRRAFKSSAEYSRAYFASFAEDAMNDHIALKDVITKKQKIKMETAMTSEASIDLLSAYCEPSSHRLLDREARRLAYEQLCEHCELRQQHREKKSDSRQSVKNKLATTNPFESLINEVLIARVGFRCGCALGMVLYLFMWPVGPIFSYLFTDETSISVSLRDYFYSFFSAARDGITIIYNLFAAAYMWLRLARILTPCGFFVQGLLMECLRLLKVYVIVGALFALGTNILEPLLYSDVSDSDAEARKGTDTDESSVKRRPWHTDFTSSSSAFYAAEDGDEVPHFATPSRSTESSGLIMIRSRDSGASLKQRQKEDHQTLDLNGLLSDLDSVIMTLGTAAVCIAIVLR